MLSDAGSETEREAKFPIPTNVLYYQEKLNVTYYMTNTCSGTHFGVSGHCFTVPRLLVISPIISTNDTDIPRKEKRQNLAPSPAELLCNANTWLCLSCSLQVHSSVSYQEHLAPAVIAGPSS